MKRQFEFYFADKPQYATIDPREHVAHLLRAYRKHARYELRRIGLRHYQVKIGMYGAVTAIIRAI